MNAILEINDYELTLHRGAEPLYHAPAIAIVGEQEILFGEAARRQFRLYPRASNLQYLAKLNADPISQPVRQAANHADLVYLHLKELQQICSDDLLMAVPGNLSADQLGVLLGIAQEVGFKVSGFVDTAVAAVAASPAAAQVHHIDFHLQHVVVTTLEVTDEVRRVRVEDVRDCGVANLVDGWVNLIADRFVAATRFDPLHTADTEQQIYDQAFDWLGGTLTQPELSVIINHAATERRIEVPRLDIENKASQRYRRVLDALPAGAATIVSARAASIPGFLAALKAAGHAVTPLPSTAVGDGIAANLARITDNGSGLRLVTALPHEQLAAPEAAGRHAPPVTHLLDGHSAWPASDSGAIRITVDRGEQWLQPGDGLTLNGEAVRNAARLRIGDIIGHGERSLVAITVHPQGSADTQT